MIKRKEIKRWMEKGNSQIYLDYAEVGEGFIEVYGRIFQPGYEKYMGKVQEFVGAVVEKNGKIYLEIGEMEIEGGKVRKIEIKYDSLKEMFKEMLKEVK